VGLGIAGVRPSLPGFHHPKGLIRARDHNSPTIFTCPIFQANTLQMFTLLQVDRIIPFQPSCLENLIELEKEHDPLSERSVNLRGYGELLHEGRQGEFIDSLSGYYRMTGSLYPPVA
jgi:hypothetical protein